MQDRAAWRAKDIALEEQTYQLTQAEIAELEDALKATAGKPYVDIARGDVKFPKLDATLARLYGEVRDGAGFILLRGIPVRSHSKDEVRLMAWMIATRFGYPVSQNAKGQRIADVMDTMKGSASPRGYHSNAELRLHTDPASDMIGLCCIEDAKSGGDSMLASAVTVYEEIRATRPDLIKPLCTGFAYARFGEGRADDPEITEYPVPLLAIKDGKVSCRYGSNRIRGAVEALERPMTPQQSEALALFRETAQANAVTFRMGPGDFLLCNNLTVLHARTDFVDNDDPQRPRHLLRFWLEGTDFRPIPPEMNFFNRGKCGILPKAVA